MVGLVGWVSTGWRMHSYVLQEGPASSSYSLPHPPFCPDLTGFQFSPVPRKRYGPKPFFCRMGCAQPWDGSSHLPGIDQGAVLGTCELLNRTTLSLTSLSGQEAAHVTPGLALTPFSMLETQGELSRSPTKVAGLICPPCQAPSSQALTLGPLGGHAKKPMGQTQQ